jgi:hypothetical protein
MTRCTLHGPHFPYVGNYRQYAPLDPVFHRHGRDRAGSASTGEAELNNSALIVKSNKLYVAAVDVKGGPDAVQRVLYLLLNRHATVSKGAILANFLQDKKVP